MIKVVDKYYTKLKRFFPRQWRRVVFAWQYVCCEKHSYVKLMDYAQANLDMVDILKTRSAPLYYKVPDYVGDKIHILESGGEGTTIVAKIRNGACFVYSDIVLLPNGQVFYELKENESIRYYTNFADEALLYETDTWCKIRPRQKEVNIPMAIKIGGMFGFNYYHFVYQILPKLAELDEIDPEVPILLDIAAGDVPSMKRLVEILNKQNREIIYMEYGVRYQVEELYYVSAPNMVVPNYKKHVLAPDNTACFRKESIDWLRKELLPYKADIDTPKRVFIARRKASSRRGYNEMECFAAIKEYGFVEVYPEQMSVEEQMTLFNNAEMVVGATGAAFTNLVFAKPGCKVIILSNYKINLPIFSTIAELVGAKLFYLYDESLGVARQSAKLHEQFKIDTNKLKQIVTQLL